MNDFHADKETPREKPREITLTRLENDPYALLAIARDATPEQIKDAYFVQVRAHPPEREPDVFKTLRAAYDRLRIPERRLETDMLLLRELALPAALPEPMFDLQVHPQDLVAIARAQSDLERVDFRNEFRTV